MTGELKPSISPFIIRKWYIFLWYGPLHYKKIYHHTQCQKALFLHLRVSPQNRQNNGTQTAGLETGILRRLYYGGTMVKNCFFDTTNKE